MMKILCTTALLLLTTFGYGQKSTLLQNVNFRAKELNHSLNKAGDSLILESQSYIGKVAIFNNDFEKTYMVRHNKVKIPLSNIPVGRFITEVQLPSKLIIITLLRNEIIEVSTKFISKRPRYENTLASQLMSNGSTLLVKTPPIKIKKKPVKPARLYWVVTEINCGLGSRKVMRFADKETVAQMIKQNEIDIRTKSGRHNTLTIWEVYDTSKFLRYKRQNSDYTNTKETTFFNTIPFFKSNRIASNDL